MYTMWSYFFFFQAEDGIRDPLVTGVQTCALPIWPEWCGQPEESGGRVSPAGLILRWRLRYPTQSNLPPQLPVRTRRFWFDSYHQESHGPSRRGHRSAPAKTDGDK